MRRKVGYVQDRGTSFRIAYYDLNHVRQFESYPTEEEARRELAKRLSEIANGIPVSSKPNTVKFGELCADVVTDYQVRKLRSEDDIETRFRLHIVPVFGEHKAIQITTSQLKQYILRRQSEGASTGTINRELEAIRRAFLLAYREGKLLARGPHIPMLPEANARRGFFTREEVDRLCRFLPKPIDSFVLFGFLTGWRLDEIRNLKWANVDFSAGEIRLDRGTTKNGDARVFPMTDELRLLLRGIIEAGSVRRTIQTVPSNSMKRVRTMASVTNYVFVINGVPVGAFRKTWKTACIKAGLCIPSVDGEKPIVTRLFHDLRRSGAREMSNQGVPQPVIMDLMGHATDSMFTRYRIVSAEDKKRAAEIVNGARIGATKAAKNGGNQ